MRYLLVVALAGLVLAAPPAAGEPVDRVPSDLPDDARAFRDALDDIASAEDEQAMRAAYAEAEPLADDVVPHLRDLHDSGDLLAELWRLLGPEVEDGDLSDAGSLAGEAAGTLDDDLVPAADRWAGSETTVTPGTADGNRVPVVLIHPPSSGLGAFDVQVQADDGAVVPTEASVAIGQGTSDVDTANGTARLASFDGKALAGLGSTSRDVVVLGHVTYPADAGSLTVEVDVLELVDPDARPVLSVSPAGTARVADAASGLSAGTVGLVAVGVLGIGAVVGVRRLVRI